jgi:serine/threonine protein kinase
MPRSRYKPGDAPIPGSDYRLLNFIARGGFGEVWKARAPGGKEVALKLIDLTTSHSSLEVKALKSYIKLSHPYLNELQAYWQKDEDGNLLDDDGRPYGARSDDAQLDLTATRSYTPAVPAELILAITLCDETLFDRLKTCRSQGLVGIPFDELIKYFDDAAQGLTYLHEYRTHDGRPSPILHRDIKPQNMMTRGGKLQICDFGLIRTVEDLSRTDSGPAVSPPYASPESFMGEFSVQSDLYSLAISYFELRAGRLPFLPDDWERFEQHRLTPAALCLLHQQGRLSFQGVSDQEQAVLCIATRVDPTQRYSTVRAFLDDLSAAVACLSVPKFRPVKIGGGSTTGSGDYGTLQPGFSQVYQAELADSALIGGSGTFDQSLRTGDTKKRKSTTLMTIGMSRAETAGIAGTVGKGRRYLLFAAIGLLILATGGVAFLSIGSRQPEAPPPAQMTVQQLIDAGHFQEALKRVAAPGSTDDRNATFAQVSERWRARIETEINERRFDVAHKQLSEFGAVAEFQADAVPLGSKLKETWLDYVYSLRDRPVEAIRALESFKAVPEFAVEPEIALQRARLKFLLEGPGGLRDWLKEHALPEALVGVHEPHLRALSQRLQWIAESTKPIPNEPLPFTKHVEELKKLRTPLTESDTPPRLRVTPEELRQIEERWRDTVDYVDSQVEGSQAANFLTIWNAVGADAFASTAYFKVRLRVAELSIITDDIPAANTLFQGMEPQLGQVSLTLKRQYDALKQCATWCDPKLKLDLVPEWNDVSRALQAIPVLRSSLNAALLRHAAIDRKQEQAWLPLIGKLSESANLDDKPKLLEFQAQFLIREIPTRIATISDVKTDGDAWQGLLNECARLRALVKDVPLWLPACEAECNLQLGNPTDFKSAHITDGMSSPYVVFVHALALAQAGDGPAAAKQISDAYAFLLTAADVSDAPTTSVEKPDWERTALQNPTRRRRASSIMIDAAASSRTVFPPITSEFRKTLVGAFASTEAAAATVERLRNAERLDGPKALNEQARLQLGFAEFVQSDYRRAFVNLARATNTDTYTKERFYGIVGLAMSAVELHKVNDFTPDDRKSLLLRLATLPKFFRNEPKNRNLEAERFEFEVLRPLLGPVSAERDIAARDFLISYAEFLRKYRTATWVDTPSKAAKTRDLLTQALALTSDDDITLRTKCLTELGYNELTYIPDGDLKKAVDYSQEAVRIAPKSSPALGLQGYVQLLLARQEPSAVIGLKAFESSEATSRAAAEAADAASRERSLARIYLSMALLEQANYRHFFSESAEDAELKLRLLRSAEQAARDAVAGDERSFEDIAYRAEGNAAEDLAWIARQDIEANFTEACRAFNKAFEVSSADPGILAAKGRCYFRCATDSRPLTDEQLKRIAVQIQDANVADKSREGILQEAEDCFRRALGFSDTHLESLEFSGRLANWKAGRLAPDRKEEIEALKQTAREYWRRGFRAAMKQRETVYVFLFAGLLTVHEPGAARSLVTELQEQLNSPEALVENAYFDPKLEWAYLEAQALLDERNAAAAWKTVEQALREPLKAEALTYSCRKLTGFGLDIAVIAASSTAQADLAQLQARRAWTSEVLAAFEAKRALPSERARAFAAVAKTEFYYSKSAGLPVAEITKALRTSIDSMDQALTFQSLAPAEKRIAPWRVCEDFCVMTVNVLTRPEILGTDRAGADRYRVAALTHLDFALGCLDEQLQRETQEDSRDRLLKHRENLVGHKTLFMKATPPAAVAAPSPNPPEARSPQPKAP